MRNRGVAALASSVGQHLFVGERGVAGWAPVGGRECAVRQPRFVHSQEEPLIPLVVFGIAGNDFPIPIVDSAQASELAAHILHILDSPLIRMDAVANGGVFGRQSECVEAHRVQHIVALHSAQARVGVGRAHSVPVSDMEVAGGIRIHRELIPLWTRVVVIYLVRALFFPAPLPLGVYCPMVKALLRRSCNRHATPSRAVLP